MKISVIIPVYNAETFLRKAVISALQFDEVSEVLLIEDHSSDNSLEICKNLETEFDRVKLLQHADKGNHGAGATRNLGLENATGDFIAFLDADDYYLHNRFDAEKELFRDSKIEGVFGALGAEFLSKKGEEQFREKFKNTSLTTVKYHSEGKDIFNGLLNPKSNFGSFFHLNTLTIRKSALIKGNLTFNVDLKVHQDQDFIIKLAYHCNLKTGIIDKPIAIRGVHDNNRITKIKLYSEDYNNRQLLLWTSLLQWSKDKNIDYSIREHIVLQEKAFELSQKKGVSKYLSIALELLKNKNILRTRYRFNYLKI